MTYITQDRPKARAAIEGYALSLLLSVLSAFFTVVWMQTGMMPWAFIVWALENAPRQ